MGIPVPKFNIGDKVFESNVTTQHREHPCPDCLGTKKWKAISPAGKEYEAGCQRCCGSWTSYGFPTLAYSVHVPGVRSLTIGSVQIDTNDEKPVRYMCVETGVGSGSVYYENALFETSDDAMAAATADADALNRVVQEQPKELDRLWFSKLELDNATDELNRTAIWHSWYSYKNLRDEVLSTTQDESLGIDEIRERLSAEISWDTTHRTHRLPFQNLIDSAIAVADRDGNEQLKAALAELPFQCAVVVGAGH